GHRDENPSAGVRDEEPLDGSVEDGAVDVTAVRQAQRHGLPAARAQPVGERDLRLLRLGEIEDLLVRGSTQLLRELTLEVVKQGLPPHPAHASAPEGPCTPDPSTGVMPTMDSRRGREYIWTPYAINRQQPSSNTIKERHRW